MEKKAKIYIAGHEGLIGSAIVNKLNKEGCRNLITRPHKKLDLVCQQDVEKFFRKEQPEYVIMAAGKVGGINANINYPAQFIYENLAIQNNIIHFSYKYKAKKLLFLAGACCYPRECPQPIKEEFLLSGKLEPTSEPYAIAKVAGITTCQAYNTQYGANFISAVSTNAYGPNDNFDPEDSHVIAGLIRRFYEAKISRQDTITVWGTGEPLRDFIYVEDLADACFFLLRNYNEPEIINIGSGKGTSIKELSFTVKEAVGYKGRVVFDASKPDGVPQKVLDVSKSKNLGWQANISLKEGIARTYDWFLKHPEAVSK
ncbi:MAG: GDP-L-fucose synthase [Candidatus Omnitrophota bacterium]